ncbi:beta strand repeat-containing protein [Mastigocoleus testarum]|uniref:Filamentous haemagglutinin FhaB/tRNA nuclease CdiA-like TPS domain-containing protein n=1 Tax=Mastigocoleus testarum BC008 TaxID=371196 RepID=A0A0V7ZI33_9CYAN|nr:S-layer family protein [Mastigocoleus testarum]KST64233.1 hypothetical protein BC008_16490 [Mastigocoleus testarum BC008]
MLRQPLVVVNYSIFHKVIRLSTIVSLQFFLGFLSIFWQSSANAQITPDASLGTEASRVTPNVEIKGSPAERIDGGATRGINLFHSFSEFNVGESQRVYFNNPAGIENILTRVTGGKVSNILGTLGVDGRANLFFINPGGIVFGQNSSLDLGGSFVGSTANSFVFDDEFKFSATNPQTPPLLKINVPTGLQFAGNPGRIESKSTAPAGVNLLGRPVFGLRVPDGKSLLLVGGDIIIDGGGLHALGGQVQLAGIADNGFARLNVNSKIPNLNIPGNTPRTDVVIQNRGRVNVVANNQGSISVHARNIEITGGYLFAGIASGLGSNESQAGDITLNAQQSTVVKGFSIQGRKITSRIESLVNTGAIGEGGDIKITTDSFYVKDFSAVRNSTKGQGNTGRILVQAQGKVSLSEGSTIFNRVLPNSIGNTGGVIIKANSFSLLEGAEIQTGNEGGVGNAGNVKIDVRGHILFDGLYSDGFASGIFTGIDPQGIGNSGDINIKANSFTLSDGARLQTKTEGQGNAGNVKINVRDRIVFDGGRTNPNLDFQHLTGIFTTLETDSFRQGGNVEIDTGSVTIKNGAEITANTFKFGNSGNITIRARESVILDGFNSHGGTSGVFAAIGNPKFPSVGQGGSINIFAQSLSLTNSAAVTSSTSIGSKGNAGKVAIVTSKGVIVKDNANIIVDNQGSGIGGDVELKTDFLTLDNGKITAKTRASKGGNITLKLKDLLLLRNSSQISSTAGNQQFGGDGGNINIDTPFIVASPQGNNDITANAFSGRGGNINIATQGIFGLSPRSREELQSLLNTNNPADLEPENLPSSDITAISQQNPSLSGQISINNLVEPSRGTEELPTDVVDAASLISRNICIASGQRSQFFITGKGGLPPSPYNVFDPNSTWEDWSVTKEREISKPKPKTKPTQTKNQLSKPIEQNKNEQPNPIVQAQDWVLDSNGNVVLTSKPVKVTQQSTWLHQEDCLRLGKKKS